MSEILSELHQVLESRKGADPDSSYVASLYAKGLNKILEKVGEEAVETILAARDAEVSGDNQALISETADLWFHSLVMLAKLGEHPDKVLNFIHSENMFRVTHSKISIGRLMLELGSLWLTRNVGMLLQIYT